MSVQVNITISDGPDKGKTYDFNEGEAVFGRSKADVKINDTKISGRHAKIVIDPEGSVFIEDLNSTNGTYIGGRKIQGREPLQNLDEVVMGLSKLSVAIVEKLEEFKRDNVPCQETIPFGESPPLVEGSQTRDMPRTSMAEPSIKLPSDSEFYTESAIHRIDELIQQEMKTFSRWDHPAVIEESESKVVKVKVTLRIKQGPDGTAEIVCSKPVSTLGRKDVDFRINDPDCSRKHCALEILNGEKVFARDLASTNGTHINGKKITYEELKTGDFLQIGQTVFEVTVEGNKN